MTKSAAYYISETDKAIREIQKAVFWAKAKIVFVLAGSAIGIPLLILTTSLSESSEGFAAVLLVSIIIEVTIVALYLLRHRHRTRLVTKLPDPPAEWLDNSELSKFVEDARQQLVGGRYKEIRIKLNLIGQVGASVYDSDDGAFIVVTLGLVVLSDKYPQRAKAIIFHEIAHLLHRDSELFSWAPLARALETLAIIQIGLLFLTIFLTWLSGGEWNLQDKAGMLPLMLIMQATIAISDARLKSEILADVRAATKIGPKNMIDAIRFCVKADDYKMDLSDIFIIDMDLRLGYGRSLHPHRNVRIVVLCLMIHYSKRDQKLGTPYATTNELPVGSGQLIAG